jgi:crotonobetainyl-CoA:carnitine CoA-transferase CaiB-like acyl-CoA transferase
VERASGVPVGDRMEEGPDAGPGGRAARAWAASGAMALTGWPDGPALGCPAALVALVERAADLLRRHSSGRVDVDGLALLGERAALAQLTRRGEISCGGSTRLVPAADGWLAVSLARSDDRAALPAWLQCEVPAEDPWPAVAGAARARPASVLDDRAALLGLPVAALASVAVPDHAAFTLPLGAEGPLAPRPPLPVAGARVLDLSSLWSGPLCAQLLGAAGAEVTKVESTARPDGARHGPGAFFDLLNGAKRSVALELETAAGRAALRGLIASADVVIESARPRALEQMGIQAAIALAEPAGPRVWVSVTSHGRGPGRRERVGFGDVAAVAGGLVGADHDRPCFLADAVADPLTGLVAAAACLEALGVGGSWLIDAAMAPLSAAVAAGPPLDVRGLRAGPPRARPVLRSAPALGADTTAVMAALRP